MPEHYFDHDADIGLIGRGPTIEACFIDAAVAMFALMADLALVKPKQSVTIEFDEDDIELAFVTWLNRLIAEAQTNNLIFSRFELKHHKQHWHGKALGETWRNDIEHGIEVKGATLTMLSVKKINHAWEAKCIVDV